MVTNRLTFNSLQRNELPYNGREITKYILICQYCTNERSIEKNKLLLFEAMSKIIVKNINNFFYLIRNYDRDPLYTRDDLVGECFIIMNKCVKSFDIKKFKDFHWFFNKALTRGLLRILEKSYLKHNKNQRTEDVSHIKTAINPSLNFSDYYVEKVGLTEQEKKVLQSKIEMVKIKDFVKTNKDISESEYYKLFNSIKDKIKPILDECSN